MRVMAWPFTILTVSYILNFPFQFVLLFPGPRPW